MIAEGNGATSGARAFVSVLVREMVCSIVPGLGTVITLIRDALREQAWGIPRDSPNAALVKCPLKHVSSSSSF